MNTDHFARARRLDRLARIVITAGGITVIACVIAILLLIAKEAVPLFRAPVLSDRTQVEPSSLASAEVLGIGIDEYLEGGYVLTADGRYAFFSIADGSSTAIAELDAPLGAQSIERVHAPGDDTFTLLWDNGAVTLERVAFAPRFDAEGTRTIAHVLQRLMALETGSGGALLSAQARAPDAETRVCVAQLEGGGFTVIHETQEEDFLGNQTVEQRQSELSLPFDIQVRAFALDGSGTIVYAGTADGRVLGWDLSRPGAAVFLEDVQINKDGSAVTALCIVTGGESIGVADAAGRYTIWSRVPLAEGKSDRRLARIHTLTASKEPIVEIVASRRDKSLMSLTASGRLRLDHVTSERLLLDLAPKPDLVQVALSRRGNGFVGRDRQGFVRVWDLRNPHPETTAQVLFGKVWYEGYKRPEYMWQSSSASDDFEPKLSLVPLLFGSIKGTFYAMIFAVPLALFGALYTSQLTRPEIRDVVKPVVEVMAAIPSVIIGFLAALWLAPLFDRNLGALFLSFALVPAVILLTLVLWQVLRRWRPVRVIENGYEFLVVVPSIAVGICLAAWIGPWMESAFFDGNLKLWMFREAGIRYDPRNCIVIAFALGFAVIPIIFTIAEDAFSNVPRSLTAASLAMGASRWQTVWRVVLPSASPGIFAGIVIGLGRAVGETMIVLMATGNTPILDWSPFNGMRTLSANIAVEVPEAPFGGTLYRVLFLSAVVLFLMTFVLNTLAEVVRQRLRRKYAQFQ